jgi:hypothetical protein
MRGFLPKVGRFTLSEATLFSCLFENTGGCGIDSHAAENTGEGNQVVYFSAIFLKEH